ncbi:MAG: flagellar motor protein MotB [Hyphomicrobiales bacterium]|nr:flagellar motor protein MotB [Hyphomicrobiales bacterium]
MEDKAAPEVIVVRRRADDGDEGHHGGVWKIAYADFMTAMMAFFLVMWLVSATDEKTVAQLAAYFNPIKLTDSVPADKGLRNLDAGEGREDEKPVETPKPEPKPGQAFKPKGEVKSGVAAPDVDDASLRDPFAAPAAIVAAEAKRTAADAEAKRERAGGLTRDGADEAATPHAKAEDSPPTPLASLERDLSTMREALAAALSGAPPEALKSLSLAATPEGALISLSDSWEFEMFAVGTAQPHPALTTVLEGLAAFVKGREERLVVRGHTDGRAFKARGDGNWRLSTERAHAAYLALLAAGAPERRFARIEGRADRDLAVPADPLSPRNRRIEILLMKD